MTRRDNLPANAYWLEVLSSDSPEATIAADYARSPHRAASRSMLSLHWDQEISGRVVSLARGDDASTFTIVAAAVAVLLSKYVRADEITIGTPPRHTSIGGSALASMLPLRVPVDRQAPCSEVLAVVQKVCERGFEHETFDISELLSALGASASADRCPLFDVAVSLEGYTKTVDVSRYPVDIVFAFGQFESGLSCRVHYRADLYTRRKIEIVGDHLKSVFRDLVSEMDPAVAQVQMLSDEEREELIFSLNDNAVEFPLEQTFHGLFEKQVGETPERAAAVFQDEQLNYTELNHRANRLARALVSAGLEKGEFVAILQHRNCNFLVAMLAAFKAGGAYVPIDPSYPLDRIEYMLTDSAARYVVTEGATASELAGLLHQAPELRLIVLQSGGIAAGSLGDSTLSVLSPEDLAALPKENLNLPLSGRDRAYMIYTSGSTGMPKGAICRHDGALNHLFGELHGLGIDGAFSFLQSAASSSDISVWQFMAPVLTGGTTHIVDHETVVDPELLFETIRANHLDLVELVPVVLRALVDYASSLPESERALPALRCMMATGDALPVDVVNAWFVPYPSIPVANTYGPTEASDDVTLYVTHEPMSATQTIVPIGRPMPNLNIFILDPSLSLVPFGIPGEICVSGVGVGEGYWRQPEKTEAVFIANPLPGAPGDMVYRTGDLGRWLPDGSIEFLGRIDQQVKIRGFRIEPGEVETALLKHHTVDEAVVMARVDQSGNKHLVAYVAPTAGTQVSSSELRGFLGESLPDYMVPAIFVTIESMPLTPIGKIDRKALPGIEDVAHVRSDSHVEPRTETERTLARIWADVLGLPDVGVLDDFIQLGGDSILSITVASQAKASGLPIRPKHVFQHPTVAALALAAEKLSAAATETDSPPAAQAGEDGTVVFPLARLKPEDVKKLQERFDTLEDAYPLSPTQLGLYLQWLLSPRDSGVYVEQISIRLDGALEPETLERAWCFAVQQTPVLRTAFVRRGLPTPHQLVLSDIQPVLRWVDLRHESTSEHAARLSELAREERLRGFNLAEPPLMRVLLVTLDDATTELLWTYHHIILDGWSEPLVLEQVSRAYDAFQSGREPAATVVAPYRAFIAWLSQQEWREGETYWKQQLAGFAEPTPLPSSRGDGVGGESGISHGWQDHRLSPDDAERLATVTRGWKLTLGALLQGTWALLLARHAKTEDVVFGSAVSGRQPDLVSIESIPGLFIATLPVRARASGKTRVQSWLKLLQTQMVEMRQYEHVGDHRMRAAFEAKNKRVPLFESVFVMAEEPIGQLANRSWCGLAVRAAEYMTMPHYPLTLFVVRGESVLVRLVYDKGLFSESDVRRLLDEYVTLLHRVTDDPDQPLDNLRDF